MDLKEFLDAVASLGALGFAVIVLYGFFIGRLHSETVVKTLLADRDATIAYERAEKEKAFELARRAMDSHDEIADAVKERNRLDRERLLLQRQRNHD